MYPTGYISLSKPAPTTVRNSSSGISPANTVAEIIRELDYMQAKLGLGPAGVSFTANAGTDTLTATAHGLANNDIVYVSSTGALPGGLAIDTKYFVVSTATNTFQLSATRAGGAIDLTSAGSGTHTFLLMFSENKLLVSGSSSRAQWTNSIDLSSGALILPQGTNPTSTVEGSIYWDTDDDLLFVGAAGGARKTMVDLTSTQTLTNKTLAGGTLTGTVSGSATYSTVTLVTPTIASFVNATHNHQNNAGGSVLNGGSAITAGTITQDRLATMTRKLGIAFPVATFPAAGTTNGPHIKFIVPDNYVSGNIVLKGLFRNSVGSNAVILRVNTFRFRDATAFSQIDSNVNFDRTVSSTNSISRTITTIAAANFQAGDALFVTITRLGDDAGDTNTGAEDHDGAWIEYTGYV